MAIPDHLIKVAHVLGDRTDKIDLPVMQVMEAMARPVETYLLESIPSVSPRSSIVKALAIMEMFNTSYVFLIICVAEAERSGVPGYRISPVLWLRKGTPVMLVTLCVSSTLMAIFFDYYRG